MSLRPGPVALALMLGTAALLQAEDPRKTADAMRVFDENKFGLFIHWGLYAIPAGEWDGKYVRGNGEWIMNRARIPVKDYEKLAAQFNPKDFDANQWAALAKAAGMKYMVITAKHHDGFAMFGSKASPYNIVDATPFHRDPMKELAAACAKVGIQFGFYYSQDQDWHEAGGRGNNWDFKDPRDSQGYLDGKVLPQVKELLTGYGKLGLLWFDTPGMLSEKQVIELRDTVKTLQPSCLLNSRIGHNRGDYFQTGDNAIPLQVYSKGKWEVPATLNDTWGFKKNDTNWKDPADLIAKLADITAKGGNYLLNIGPTSLGVIPEGSQKIFRTVGKWLAVNGESIYGTSPSPFFFPDVTWRATVKPGKIYLHIINWPSDRKLELAGLESRVTSAKFLAGGAPVKYKSAGGVLHFDLPAVAPDPYDSVLVLDIADQQPKVDAAFSNTARPARVDLYAWTSRLRGEEIRYDKPSLSASHFKQVSSERNELWWYPYGSLDGDYGLEVTYACDDAVAGSPFRIGVAAGNASPVKSEAKGTIEATGGKFVTKPVEGTIHVTPADQHIAFSLPGDDKSAAARIRKITLVRK